MSLGRRATVLLILALCLSTLVAASAQTPASKAASRSEVLIVLRGFGYGGNGERALRALEPDIHAAGMDLLIPDYLSRGGLDDSGVKLRRFFDSPQVARYERVHVFAYIAGGWTLNPIIESGGIPRLATVVYDRSPYQERAPRIADENLHFLTWVRYGSPVFDLARTPYPPMTRDGVKVSIVVETTPTEFIRDHAAKARSYGPFRFDCEAFAQRSDDCMFVQWNHDDLYVRFATVWPDVLSFIRQGRFSAGANRTPPDGDALAAPRKP